MEPGTRIADRYVIERALAKGGMGTVYVALDERMNARVALKVTGAAGATADELSKRFAREARIGHLLGSTRQGFVRASDWGRIDAVQLYLVMDLVADARPLDLQTGAREERLARWRRAAALVQIAHEQGVVHRDLKPANFLQAPDGSIALTDFGLAKVMGEAGDDEAGLTMTGVAFGTPAYMPPEQLEDVKHADQRADVFALGCMLFEAAVLSRPYPATSPTGVMGAHLKVRTGVTPAPRPRHVDASVPEALDEACARAIELDVTRRLSSVATLVAALEGVSVAAQLDSAGSAPTVTPGAPPTRIDSIGSAPTTPPGAIASIGAAKTTPPPPRHGARPVAVAPGAPTPAQQVPRARSGPRAPRVPVPPARRPASPDAGPTLELATRLLFFLPVEDLDGGRLVHYGARVLQRLRTECDSTQGDPEAFAVQAMFDPRVLAGERFLRRGRRAWLALDDAAGVAELAPLARSIAAECQHAQAAFNGGDGKACVAAVSHLLLWIHDHNTTVDGAPGRRVAELQALRQRVASGDWKRFAAAHQAYCARVVAG